MTAQPARRGVVTNSLWSTVGSLSATVAVTIASIVTARLLGPQDFGRYVFAVFLYGTAAQLALWGLPGAVTRFLAMAGSGGDPAEQRAVVARSLVAGGTGTLLAVAGLLTLAAAGVLPRSTTLLAAVVTLSLGPTQLLLSVLTGRESFRTIALWQIAVGLVNPVLTVVVLLLGGRVTAVLLVDVVVTAAGFTALLRLARPVNLTTSVALPAGFWRYALTYACLILLGVVVFQRSEIVILQALRSSKEVALYGVAFGLSQLVPRFTGPALGVLAPAFARLDAGAAPALDRAVQRAFDVAAVMGVLFTCLGLTLAPAAVALLYGDGYAGASAAAAVMMSMSWLALINAVLTPVAQARAHMRFLVLVNGIAAVVNIVAAILLVHVAGVVGAAVANVAAQGLVGLGLLVWTRRHLPAVSYGVLWRVLPAAVAATAVGISAARLPPLAAILVGALVGVPVFLALARATAALDEEAQQLLVTPLRGVITRLRSG